MIYSDKQCSVSIAELLKLKEALSAAENRATDQAWLKEIEIDALRSQIAEIEAEIQEYKLLKSGEVSFSKTYALEELPRVLVQARIASGLSQSDLAQKLGMKPQQVQRYEATNYMGASLARLIEISRALGVKTSGTFEGEKSSNNSVFSWSGVEDIAWHQFPYKEMVKRKWFHAPKGSDPMHLAKEYFFQAAGPAFVTAYHRKKMRSSNVPNEFSLLAWQARILHRARIFEAENSVSRFDLDDRWLSELVKLTRSKNGVKRVRELLASKGIILVFERHLPGSYLDGAAMLNEAGRPVIGLTLRHDRLDNFWFVLFHELGHVFLHLFDGLKYDFFDEGDSSNDDTIELEADRFALNTLIPSNIWTRCLSRFALSKESIEIDAENLGIHPSIIAGRIRKERENYRIFNDLVGQGQVRVQIEDVRDDLE